MNKYQKLLTLGLLVSFQFAMAVRKLVINEVIKSEDTEKKPKVGYEQKMIFLIRSELKSAGISLMSPEPKTYSIVPEYFVEEKLQRKREKLSSSETKLISFEPNDRHYIVEGHLLDAARLLALYHIRVQQDIACCHEKEHTNKFVEEYLKHQDFVQAIKRYISQEELNQIYLEQIPRLMHITSKNGLSDPCWILKYSLGTNKKMVSRNLWKAKRVAVLKALKKKLQAK